MAIPGDEKSPRRTRSCNKIQCEEGEVCVVEGQGKNARPVCVEEEDLIPLDIEVSSIVIDHYCW